MKKFFWLILVVVAIALFWSQVSESHPPPIPTSSYIKSKQWHNVKDYGAKSDSTGVGTIEAFHLAVAAAPDSGGIIYIPAGRYRLDTMWTISKSNLTIFGTEGTYLYPNIVNFDATTGWNGITFDSVSNVTFRNITVVGNTDSSTIGNNNQVKGNGIFILRCDNVKISNCEVYDFEYGIRILGDPNVAGGQSQRCIVENSHVWGNIRDGIILNNASYNIIRNNRCNDNGKIDSVINDAGSGIAIRQFNFGGQEDTSWYNLIEGNVCENNRGQGIILWRSDTTTEDIRHTIIRGNTCNENRFSGIMVASSPYTKTIDNITYDNNRPNDYITNVYIEATYGNVGIQYELTSDSGEIIGNIAYETKAWDASDPDRNIMQYAGIQIGDGAPKQGTDSATAVNSVSTSEPPPLNCIIKNNILYNNKRFQLSVLDSSHAFIDGFVANGAVDTLGTDTFYTLPRTDIFLYGDGRDNISIDSFVFNRGTNIEHNYYRVDDAPLTLNGAFTFPIVDGTVNQMLKTDGSGAVSWATPPGAAGGDGAKVDTSTSSSTPVVVDVSDFVLQAGGRINLTVDASDTITIGLTGSDFHVGDYGAIGDSATDDLAAIQATIVACANAGGGTVILAPGKTYRVGTTAGVDSNLYIPIGSKNVRISGYGSRLVTNIHLDGGGLIGSFGDSTTWNENIVIEGLTIHDYSAGQASGNNAIWGVWTDGFIVKNNRIERASHKGIVTHFDKNIWFDNNIIDTAWYAGIVIEPGSYHVATSQLASRRAWVTNNWIGWVDSADGDDALVALTGALSVGCGISLTTGSVVLYDSLLDIIVANNYVGHVKHRKIRTFGFQSGLIYGNIIDTLITSFDVAGWGKLRLHSSEVDGQTDSIAILMRHEDWDEEDILIARGWSIAGLSDLYIGGGSGDYNAFERIKFYTGDGDDKTLTGSLQLELDSNKAEFRGTVSINNPTSNIPLSMFAGNNFWKFSLDGATPFRFYMKNDSVSTSMLTLDPADTTVGIYTNDPATGYRLHVNGPTRIDNRTTISSAVGGATVILADTVVSVAIRILRADTGWVQTLGGSAPHRLSYWLADTNSVLANTPLLTLEGIDSTVGINVADPDGTYRLHVVGDAYVNGTLKVGAFTIPKTDGTVDQMLKTDGSGALSWATPPGAAGGTTDSIGFVFGDTTKWQVDKALKISMGTGILNTPIADSSGTDTTTISTVLGVAITSGEITDDEIVNADINSAAAIVYSKLAFSNNIVAGDIATSAVATAEILDATILEADLKVVNTPNDEEILTFESSTGDFEWHTPAELGLATAIWAESADSSMLVDVADGDTTMITFDNDAGAVTWGIGANQTSLTIDGVNLSALNTDIAGDSVGNNAAMDSVAVWDNRAYPDASVTQKGIASFNATDFSDASGVITIDDDGHAHTTSSISGLVDADMANDALDPDKIVGDAVDNNRLDSNVIAAIVHKAERDASGNVITTTYAPLASPTFTGVVAIPDFTLVTGAGTDAYDATDTPTDAQVLTWSTGGIIDWRTSSSSVNWNSIGDAGGDGSIDFGATNQTIVMSHTAGASGLIFDFNQVDDGDAVDYSMVLDFNITSESGDVNDSLRVIDITYEEGTANTIMDAAISINNLETTTATMSDGIIIKSDGVNLGITDGVDVSDGNILNAINIGANVILTAAQSIASTELDRLSGVTGALTFVGGTDVAIADGGTGASGLDDILGGTGITATAGAATIIGGDATIAIDLTDAFAWTGVHDFGGATSLELPAIDNPVTDAEGEIAWDANDDAIEVFSGDEAASVLIPIYYHISIPLVLPDSIQIYAPNLFVFHVNALMYPHGIVVDLISIQLDADAAHTVVVEEWSGADPPVLENITTTVTTGSADTYAEEAPDNDAIFDVGDWIVLNLTAAQADDNVTVEIFFHVVAGD